MAYQGVDLNNLNAYDLVAVMPTVQPRYYPEAPFREDTFATAYCHMVQRGTTTLDEYFAPDAPIAPYSAQGQSRASSGNGIVYAGNAPYAGIYTGIQQE